MMLGSLLGFIRGGNFFTGLAHGDPVAWVILVICFSMTLYTALAKYRGWRSKQTLAAARKQDTPSTPTS